MNRRFFLQLVAAGLSAELADRLLWVPNPMITVPAMPLGRLSWHIERPPDWITRFDVLLGFPEIKPAYAIGPACSE